MAVLPQLVVAAKLALEAQMAVAHLVLKTALLVVHMAAGVAQEVGAIVRYVADAALLALLVPSVLFGPAQRDHSRQLVRAICN